MLIIFVACQQKAPTESTNDAKIDSLLKKIDALQSDISRLDSNLTTPKTTDMAPEEEKTETVKEIKKPKEEKVIRKTEEVKEKQPQELKTVKAPTEADTIYHYLRDGRISVKLHPWADSKQKIEIFNPFGQVIYTLENMRMSYSSFHDLRFRDNGSLERVKSSFNPGASMYMYETIILFDIDNEPKSKQNFTIPAHTMADAMGETYLWDRKNKKWIKQEIIKEYNSPE